MVIIRLFMQDFSHFQSFIHNAVEPIISKNQRIAEIFKNWWNSSACCVIEKIVPDYSKDVCLNQYSCYSKIPFPCMLKNNISYLQIRAYLNERPPLSGKITVADPLQPSRLKLGVWLRYHLKAYENTNGAIRGFFEFCSLAQVIALQSIKFSFF